MYLDGQVKSIPSFAKLSPPGAIKFNIIDWSGGGNWFQLESPWGGIWSKPLLVVSVSKVGIHTKVVGHVSPKGDCHR